MKITFAGRVKIILFILPCGGTRKGGT